MPEATEPSRFVLRDFVLQSNVVLTQAQLCYQTYGQLNADRSNVVLYPTSYGAQHTDIDWLIGVNRILDPTRYFVIIPNMFGNGLSSSPSNLPEQLRGPHRPLFTHVDNVNAQRQLLLQVFGIERIALAYGWSMGAQQALHWGALYPDCVERIAAVCGTAKTSVHNQVFLESLYATLTTDLAWDGHQFREKPVRGLKAFARVYAGWALSQAYYREGCHLELGYASLEDYLTGDWETGFLRRNADNLLSMLQTWMHSDISANPQFQGDISAALRAIRARTFLIPCDQDLYFTVEDCRREAVEIPDAQLRPWTSVWGHRAGNPARSPADERYLREQVSELLALPAPH